MRLWAILQLLSAVASANVCKLLKIHQTNTCRVIIDTFFDEIRAHEKNFEKASGSSATSVTGESLCMQTT